MLCCPLPDTKLWRRKAPNHIFNLFPGDDSIRINFWHFRALHHLRLELLLDLHPHLGRGEADQELLSIFEDILTTDEDILGHLRCL